MHRLQLGASALLAVLQSATAFSAPSALPLKLTRAGAACRYFSAAE
jgi:hypothetical protein